MTFFVPHRKTLSMEDDPFFIVSFETDRLEFFDDLPSPHRGEGRSVRLATEVMGPHLRK